MDSIPTGGTVDHETKFFPEYFGHAVCMMYVCLFCYSQIG